MNSVLKRAVLGMALTFGVAAGASQATGLTTLDLTPFMKSNVYATARMASGLNLKVGDEAHYVVDLGGFLKGKMDMSVREETADGFWLVQDLDVVIQKQKVESLLDKNTGEVKKMIVNGKEQAPQKQDIKILETKEDQITVPAGTFKTIYVKAHENSQNTDIEEWINPRDVPVGGAVQIATQQQGISIKIQLSSFKKQ